MLSSFRFCLMASGFAVLAMLGCSEENVTNPTTIVADTTFVTNYDTVYIVDSIVVTDTVAPTLYDDWLRFSAYTASVEFVKDNYPERASDRFSTTGEYCSYGSSTPAGRAGFDLADNGDGTFTAQGYTFEHQFGADGFVWGATENQPTENTYYYTCELQYVDSRNWELRSISLQAAGDYIRDTRHD